MREQMKVAVMTAVRKIEFEQRQIPVPTDTEVLIKIEHVGVCGSDLHYFEKGRIGDFVVEPPFVLGHEAAGVVVATGSKVLDLRTGDKVALEPGKACGHCEYCKTGRYNLCPEVAFFATPPVNGVFQEYVCHDAELCFKLPEGMSSLEGALVEPLAVGMHAAGQSAAAPGQTAVVMGAGCIGLVTLMALKDRGVSQVYVADIAPKRLEKAVAAGADHTINGSREDIVQTVMELTQGRGADIIIETAGSEITLAAAIEVAKKGAAIVLVGYYGSDYVSVPLNKALDKELNIKTIFRYRHIYPAAIQAVASGRIDISGIVTNRYPFEEIQKALDESIDCKQEIVKSVLTFGE